MNYEISERTVGEIAQIENFSYLYLTAEVIFYFILPVRDEVGYTVSGWGKFGGTYTAKVEKLTNPNYVLPADATCRFTIDANPIEVAIDVAVDIYDIIPDSAKEAVANAEIIDL